MFIAIRNAEAVMFFSFSFWCWLILCLFSGEVVMFAQTAGGNFVLLARR